MASKIPYWPSFRTYLQAKKQTSIIKQCQFVHPCRMPHGSVTPNTISGAWKNFSARKFIHPPPDCAYSEHSISTSQHITMITHWI